MFIKKCNAVLFGLVLCFSACRVQQNPSNHRIEITNKEWLAVEIGKTVLSDLKEEQLPTMKLSDEKVSGFTSCNRYHGTYNLKDNQLSFSPPAQTKMFCQETHEMEANFTTALLQTRYWNYKKGKLYLLEENKKVLLVFREK